MHALLCDGLHPVGCVDANAGSSSGGNGDSSASSAAAAAAGVGSGGSGAAGAAGELRSSLTPHQCRVYLPAAAGSPGAICLGLLCWQQLQELAAVYCLLWSAVCMEHDSQAYANAARGGHQYSRCQRDTLGLCHCMNVQRQVAGLDEPTASARA